MKREQSTRRQVKEAVERLRAAMMTAGIDETTEIDLYTVGKRHESAREPHVYSIRGAK